MPSYEPKGPEEARNWRGVLRGAAMVVNALFAMWLFALEAVWGHYVDGGMISIPPILAIIALALSVPKR